MLPSRLDKNPDNLSNLKNDYPIFIIPQTNGLVAKHSIYKAIYTHKIGRPYIRHDLCNVRGKLKADFHLAENIARSTFSAHFPLNCSNQIQISEHISKESEREKSIARHFPLNGNPP